LGEGTGKEWGSGCTDAKGYMEGKRKETKRERGEHPQIFYQHDPPDHLTLRLGLGGNGSHTFEWGFRCPSLPRATPGV